MHTNTTLRITAYFMLLLITGLLRKEKRPVAPGYSEAHAEAAKDTGNQ